MRRFPLTAAFQSQFPPRRPTGLTLPNLLLVRRSSSRNHKAELSAPFAKPPLTLAAMTRLLPLLRRPRRLPRLLPPLRPRLAQEGPPSRSPSKSRASHLALPNPSGCVASLHLAAQLAFVLSTLVSSPAPSSLPSSPQFRASQPTWPPLLSPTPFTASAVPTTSSQSTTRLAPSTPPSSATTRPTTLPSSPPLAALAAPTLSR